MHSPKDKGGLPLPVVDRDAHSRARRIKEYEESVRRTLTIPRLLTIPLALAVWLAAALLYWEGMPLTLDTLWVGCLVVFCAFPVFFVFFPIYTMGYLAARALWKERRERASIGE